MSVTAPTGHHHHSTADSILHSVGNLVRNAADQIHGFVHRVSVNTQATLYGLRQEVPFERWFYHYGLEQNVSDTQITDKVEARAWAVASLGESLLRATIELVTYAISKILGQPTADEHLEVLQAQGTSISLSLTAVISPEEAVRTATAPGENDLPRIGSLLSNWRWGTPYYGTVTIPLTHLECSQYNWVRS